MNTELNGIVNYIRHYGRIKLPSKQQSIGHRFDWSTTQMSFRQWSSSQTPYKFMCKKSRRGCIGQHLKNRIAEIRRRADSHRSSAQGNTKKEGSVCQQASNESVISICRRARQCQLSRQKQGLNQENSNCNGQDCIGLYKFIDDGTFGLGTIQGEVVRK